MLQFFLILLSCRRASDDLAYPVNLDFLKGIPNSSQEPNFFAHILKILKFCYFKYYRVYRGISLDRFFQSKHL